VILFVFSLTSKSTVATLFLLPDRAECDFGSYYHAGVDHAPDVEGLHCQQSLL
jgi:hypothetical protein